MNRISFIFLAGFYLLMVVSGGFGELSIDIQLYLSGFLILLIGIPHGAVDHILYKKAHGVPSISFYGFYLGLMMIYGMTWLFFPVISFMLFLVISAYHFGESQFSESLKKISHLEKNLLRMFWGTLVIAALICLNLQELQRIFSGYDDILALGTLFHKEVFWSLLISSGVGTILLLFGLAYQKKIKLERAFGELYILALIFISFYLLPVILGFTLFFTTLHSLKVLNQEFHYLSEMDRKIDVLGFIKMLAPYTLISVVGIALLLTIRHMGWIPYSAIFLGILGISILTLPHSVVMNSFYRKLSA